MQARIELAPEATSPRLARALTTTVLNHWGFGDAVDVAVLLVDELVTNALLHAGTPIEVALIERGPVVRVVVSDRSGVIPRPRTHSVGAVTGRGLQLVSLLASDWGAEPTPTGK
jgi:anti-sigma regulatory factor (Ser/Thr protein kinase)